MRGFLGERRDETSTADELAMYSRPRDARLAGGKRTAWHRAVYLTFLGFKATPTFGIRS
jgi:hypothetical protein